jgi:RNA polymerase sigma factor (sigma-70 family)
MQPHPLIHTELARQRELSLRGSAARRRTPAEDSSTGNLAPLVRAAKAGDGGAWDSLVRRFTPTLRGIVRGYRLNAADVDDVVQSAWTSAFVHIGGLREPEAIGGWLAVTARREALRTIERRGREILVDEPDPSGRTETPTAERALIKAEETDAVHAAVDRLPDRQRRLMRALLSDSELAYTEVSNRLEMPVGSIGPTRERALAVLRRDRRLSALLIASEK